MTIAQRCPGRCCVYGFSTNTLTAAVTAPIVKRLDKPASASAPTVALTVVDRPVGPGATGTTVVTAVTAARSAAVTIALTPATVAGTVSQTTSNVYDIDRQRILRKDPDGAVTLYLGGHMELRKPAGNGAEATTTYYSIAGTTVAVRTPSTLDWLLGDEHASASTTIDANTGTVRRQYYTPYGDNRATTTNGTTGGNLPTNHNYLNQTRDTTTGLNYLNNRYHDASTGTFLSVDPLIAVTGQAYLYGNGNPTTYSDPRGLEAKGPEPDAKTSAAARRSWGRLRLRSRRSPCRLQGRVRTGVSCLGRPVLVAYPRRGTTRRANCSKFWTTSVVRAQPYRTAGTLSQQVRTLSPRWSGSCAGEARTESTPSRLRSIRAMSGPRWRRCCRGTPGH